MSESLSSIITAANSLTWPAAFTIVGVSVAIAVVAIVFIRHALD